jgi:CDP-diacylglycerol---serine O-phosphatidyltransferase
LGLARYNVTAETLAKKTGKVAYFEGTPIPASVVLVLILLLLTKAGRIGDALTVGLLSIGGDFHPLVLTFVLSRALMISKSLHIPKPLSHELRPLRVGK